MALAAAWLAGATLALAGHHLVAMPVLLAGGGGALLITVWDRRAPLHYRRNSLPAPAAVRQFTAGAPMSRGLE